MDSILFTFESNSAWLIMLCRLTDAIKERERERHRRAAQQAALLASASLASQTYPKTIQAACMSLELRPGMQCHTAVFKAMRVFDWSVVGGAGDIAVVPTLLLSAPLPSTPDTDAPAPTCAMFAIGSHGACQLLQADTLEAFSALSIRLAALLTGWSSHAPASVIKTPERSAARTRMVADNLCMIVSNTDDLLASITNWFERAVGTAVPLPQSYRLLAVQSFIASAGGTPWCVHACCCVAETLALLRFCLEGVIYSNLLVYQRDVQLYCACYARYRSSHIYQCCLFIEQVAARCLEAELIKHCVCDSKQCTR